MIAETKLKKKKREKQDEDVAAWILDILLSSG